MTDNVKRSYSSELRAAQARETRRVIVSAAARLFVGQGFGRTSIDAIAEEAGVSRKTVFTSVGGKVELLKLALDWAIVGDDEQVALEHRPAVRATKQATDPDAILRGWVEIVTAIASRVAGLSAALAAAAAADDSARQLWEQAQAQRLAGARAFVGHLSANAVLRSGLTLDHAADIAWLHSDPAVYHRLVIERGWPDREFQEWLYQAIKLHLLAN
jgi:AcrR family transcriptional regulator